MGRNDDMDPFKLQGIYIYVPRYIRYMSLVSPTKLRSIRMYQVVLKDGPVTRTTAGGKSQAIVPGAPGS